VQSKLGHASIAQTDTYLNAERMGLRKSMRRSDEAATVARSSQEKAVSSTERTSHLEPETDHKPLVN
jgi:hypothetical protein